MAREFLTMPFIKDIKPPVNKQHDYYFDTRVIRFGLCAHRSGLKTFFIKYLNKFGKYRWYKIGNFGEIWTLDKARREAADLLAQVDKGFDPAGQKRIDKDAKNVAELCDWYLMDGVQDKKNSTVGDYRSTINRHIKPLIGDIPIESLTRGQVIGMMNDIIKGDKVRGEFKSDKPRGLGRVRGGKATAVKAIRILGSILEFAKHHELIGENPAHGIKRKPRIAPREVFLTLGDIETLGSIVGVPEIYGLYKAEIDAIKLLLLTGCRKSEILTLKWDYVDFENQVFKFPDTKTGAQVRPFGKGALNLLVQLEQGKKSDWVFPSQTGKGNLDNLLRIFNRICELTDQEGNRVFTKENVNLHTLRHSFASIAGETVGSEILVAALLGHTSGTVTGRYVHTIDESIIAVADKVSLAIEAALVHGADRKVQIKIPKYKRVIK